MKAALLALLPGCYFMYPHDLERKPPLKGGSQIELVDIPKTYYTHDCERRSEACVWHDGQLSRPHAYIRTKAIYAGKPISRGEISTLVEPARQQKAYAAMEKDKSTCSLSLVPSVVFAAGALADLAGGAVMGASKSDVGPYLLIGGAAAMVVGAALSYPIGGYACTRAKDTAYSVGITDDNAIEWSVEDDADHKREDELRAAVASFNSGERPSTEEAAPVVAAKTVAGDLRAAMTASGQFTTFLALADHAGVTELSGEIFAPTDAAFASVPAFDLDKVLAMAPNKLRKEVEALIVDTVEPLEDSVARGKVESRAGKTMRIKRRGGGIVVDDFPIAGEPIKTDNGVVYPLGPK